MSELNTSAAIEQTCGPWLTRSDKTPIGARGTYAMSVVVKALEPDVAQVLQDCAEELAFAIGEASPDEAGVPALFDDVEILVDAFRAGQDYRCEHERWLDEEDALRPQASRPAARPAARRIGVEAVHQNSLRDVRDAEPGVSRSDRSYIGADGEPTDFLMSLIVNAEDAAAHGCGQSDVLYENRVQGYYAGILHCAAEAERAKTEAVLRKHGFDPDFAPYEAGPGECSLTGIDFDHCPCGQHP